MTLQEFKVNENVMTVTLTNPNNHLNRNQIKLKAISELPDNWNGYGATPLAHSLIMDVNAFLPKFLKQPEIFPTANGTIHMKKIMGIISKFNLRIIQCAKSIYHKIKVRNISPLTALLKILTK